MPLLLIHDRGDTVVEPSQSEKLHAVHTGRSTLVRTEGLGHRRILSADVTLDAVTAFVSGVDAPQVASIDPFWAV